MEASKNLPDGKAGVTLKRFRTRFPLTSFAPIAVEVREVEPLEVVRKKGRIAIHVAPELADRIRRGDRAARLEMLRALGRLFLFIRPPHKVYGPPGSSKEAREARGRDEIRSFAECLLDAASKGRDELVGRLAFYVDERTAHDLKAVGVPPEGDCERDARWLADVVLDLLNFGAEDQGTTASRSTLMGASSHP